ncbi:hypothetical protein LOD99_13030 [Oopsacas minuta]|uniref:Uncharacterized protein n=1 Tax=Oopsacas minuta TaxID=111878 RepID=A0AAV7JAN2_9METZ|nr:hypothetical protein LOD99_13030 [Oopsacas minuta]
MSLSTSNLNHLRVSPNPLSENSNLISPTGPAEREGNVFRNLCFITGPMIPMLDRNRLYFFLFILVLQRIYYYNSSFLLSEVLSNCFKVFSNDGTYILSILLLSIPVLLSPIFGYLSDSPKYSRQRLLNASLFISLFSSILLLVCYVVLQISFTDFDYPFHNLPSIPHVIIQILSVISLVAFILGFALFLPLSCPYGLDILQENKIATLILYFSMFYIADNIGSLLAYFRYLHFPHNQLVYHSAASTFVILVTWLLFVGGRFLNILPVSPVINSAYSFKEGLGVLCQAIKRRILEGKTLGDVSILKYALRDHGGSYRLNAVRGTSSLIKINFALLLLLLVFGVYQTVQQMFPTQSDFFNWPELRNNKTKYYCHKERYVHFSNISFVDDLSVILFAPVFEYIFFNLTFGFEGNSNRLPWFVRCIRIGFLRRLAHQIRDYLSRYLFVECLLKRILYGIVLSLLGILVTLAVDVSRVKSNTEQVACSDQNRTITFSNISIFAQIPQYMCMGFLEVITIIGSLQFVYYQCSKHFGNSMKGFFFGLYYFYLGLGTLFPNVFYLILNKVCISYGCNYCMAYTSHCIEGELYLTWVPWVVAFFLCLFCNFIPLFIFAHSRQWRLEKNDVEFEGQYFHIIVNH